MKKFIVFFAIVAALIFSYPAYAQEKSGDWKHFSVGASYFTSSSIDVKEIYDRETVEFKGFSINGSYRLRLYRSLMLHPELSLFYQKQNSVTDKIIYSSVNPGSKGESYEPIYNERLEGFGMNIIVPIGFHFPTKWIDLDIETGPVLTVLFNEVYQKSTLLHNGTPAWDPQELVGVNRTSAKWRFGINAALKFGLGINLSYDLMMTKYMRGSYPYTIVNNRPGIFSVGLNYNF